MSLRALARVNLAAIERNAARLRRELSGSGLCAVVKADGYGHGAIPVARAALAGGADRLAVVTVEEAAELRAGGIDTPVLVMGAISAQELPVALAARADLVAWSERFVADVAAAASAPVRMHVKFDSGLGRLGTRDLQQAIAVGRRVMEASPDMALVGAMTHFATADEDLDFVERQLDAFREFAVTDAPAPARNRRACRQQRRDVTSARKPLRSGPMRDCDLRLRSDERGSGWART